MLSNLYQLSSVGDNPVKIKMLVEKEITTLEVDSGSPISAVSTKYFDQRNDLMKLKMHKTPRIFRSYSGELIVPLRTLKVKVIFKGNDYELNVFVLPGNSSPIIGRDWLTKLKILKINKEGTELQISNISNTTSQLDFKNRFKKIFSDNLGKCLTHKLSLILKDDTKTVFCKPRPVPFSMRDKIEIELNRLIANDIVQQVESSEWATPIVPVIKTNGDVRICGDYKVTVNPNLIINRYPIPRVTDLLSRLQTGKIFSKIDLTHAYQQVELDEKSKPLTTITTHKGLFQYNRLSFGIASAPGLFQGLMEKMLEGLEGIAIYFDDVLVHGSSMAEHDKNLEKLLQRLEENGFTVAYNKCFFRKNTVDFLGYQINEKGLHISPNKMDAINRIARPSTVTELKSFLGIVNYYAQFIYNYATIATPLFNLLKNNVRFKWSKACEGAFKKIKSLLTSHEVLIHYDQDRPIKVTCDASPTGLGAVLSHSFPDGGERPIAFASRTLTQAEHNYSQLDKEALAFIFAVKQFHQYVYGREFVLETDHKPLTYIFGPKKGIPAMAASRVQRWAILLSAYDFDIKYRKVVDNAAADNLSRMLVIARERGEDRENRNEYSYLNFVTDNIPSLKGKEISEATAKDPTLQIVKRHIQTGWPNQVASKLDAYKRTDLQLTIEEGCVMWGYRIVIPTILRKKVLSELHNTHLGIVKMKMLARSCVWWPGMDKEIERVVKACNACIEAAANPPRAELHTWSWPSGPGQRLHIDFCGPIDTYMYLVIIDNYSK